MTDLINDEWLYFLPRFCLAHTIDSCANERRFSCDQVIICVLRICWKRNIRRLSEMTQFSAFCFLQVVQKTEAPLHQLDEVEK